MYHRFDRRFPCRSWSKIYQSQWSGGEPEPEVQPCETCSRWGAHFPSHASRFVSQSWCASCEPEIAHKLCQQGRKIQAPGGPVSFRSAADATRSTQKTALILSVEGASAPAFQPTWVSPIPSAQPVPKTSYGSPGTTIKSIEIPCPGSPTPLTVALDAAGGRRGLK